MNNLQIEDIITFIEQNIINKKIHNNIQDNKSFYPLKINEVQQLPNNIFELGKQTYYHTGVLHFINLNNENVNISYYSSILTCLLTSFSTKLNQEKYIIDFIKHINNKNIATYLYINIFILDLEKKEIYCDDTEIIPYKLSILLLKYPNNIYEPLYTECSKTFTKNDISIKNILLNYTYVPENLNKYLSQKQIKQTKEEIYQIAQLMGIDTKKKTKKQLIDEINKK